MFKRIDRTSSSANRPSPYHDRHITKRFLSQIKFFPHTKAPAIASALKNDRSETNYFSEYLNTLYSSSDYTAMLESAVTDGLANKLPSPQTTIPSGTSISGSM